MSRAAGVCVLCVLSGHLMGLAGCRAARLKSQSTRWPHATESAPASAPSRRRRSTRELGSTSCLVGVPIYAVSNWVPSRSIACMMIARRRARATRAVRIVERLAIARALVHKPQIYLFDDSFSALDYATDARLRSALATEVTDATMIIVAQRVSTIRQADQILVLDAGRIVARAQQARQPATQGRLPGGQTEQRSLAAAGQA